MFLDPVYRLADYLDQHGRAHRASQIPPAGFWSAAAAHATPADQAALGYAAHVRGLYRDAAQLHKNAAASGNPRAISYLSDLKWLRPDSGPTWWAATHAALDDPLAVAILLITLREAGARAQAGMLAYRAAADAPLDDPGGVASLLDSLQRAGADEQAAALLARDPAAHAPLDDPGGVASLLDSLQRAGADEQATALADRLPAVGMFRLFLKRGLADQFRFGREADGTPAAPWGWEDLDLWPKRQTESEQPAAIRPQAAPTQH
jgi:hypothetical protein